MSNDIPELEWQQLQQDWQEQDYPKADLVKLTQQAQRRTSWSKWLLLFDSMGTIAVIVSFFYGLIVDAWSESLLIYLGVFSLGAIVYTLMSFRIRRIGWQIIEHSPEQVIVQAKAACLSSLQYCNLLKYSNYFVFIPANWFVWVTPKNSDLRAILAFLLLNTVLLATYYFADKCVKKRKQELEALERFISEN